MEGKLVFLGNNWKDFLSALHELKLDTWVLEEQATKYIVGLNNFL